MLSPELTHQLNGSSAKCVRFTKLTMSPMCTVRLHRDLSPDESRQENVYLKKPFCCSRSQQLRGGKSNLCSPLWAELHKCALYARAVGCYAPSVHTHRNTGLTSSTLWFTCKLEAAHLNGFLLAQAGNYHICCYRYFLLGADFCHLMHKCAWFDLLCLLPAPCLQIQTYH